VVVQIDKSSQRMAVSVDGMIQLASINRPQRLRPTRLGGPASHGCVRLHPSHAATLFAHNTRIEISNWRGGPPRRDRDLNRSITLIIIGEISCVRVENCGARSAIATFVKKRRRFCLAHSRAQLIACCSTTFVNADTGEFAA
jgi:hypothetical protein